MAENEFGFGYKLKVLAGSFLAAVGLMAASGNRTNPTTENPQGQRIADTQPAEIPASTLPLVVPGGPAEEEPVPSFTLGKKTNKSDLSETLASVAKTKSATPEELLVKYQGAKWASTHKWLAKALKEGRYDDAIEEIKSSMWAKDQNRSHQIDEVVGAINAQNSAGVKPPTPVQQQFSQQTKGETRTETYGPLTQQAITILEGRGFKKAMTPEIKTCLQNVAGDDDAMQATLCYIIAKESSFNPKASARTSSASGLTQFLDSTFLEVIRDNKHKLPEQWQYLSDKVRAKTYSQEEIQKAKIDPELSIAVGRIYTEKNLEQLQKRFPDKRITSAHLYAAHFLGLGGGSKLIALCDDATKKNDLAIKHFPKQAASNKEFFEGRTIIQVMQYIEKKMGNIPVSNPGQSMSLYIAQDDRPEIGIA